MSTAQQFRTLVNEKLAAAAEEICGVFEKTIAEFEEEISRVRQERNPLSRRLDRLDIYVINVQKAARPLPPLVPSEPQHCEERSPSLAQETQTLGFLEVEAGTEEHREAQADGEACVASQSTSDGQAFSPGSSAEEQEELEARLEGEQLQGPEEDSSTQTCVKSDSDLTDVQNVENRESDWPPSSSTQEMEAEDDEHDGTDEDDREACGVSEPTTAGQSLSPDRPAAESKDQEPEWPPSSSTQEMEAEDDEHDEDDGEACGVSEPTTAGQSLSPDRPAAESKDQEPEWPPSSSTQEMEAEDDEHDEDDGEACGVSEPTTAGQSLSPDRPAAESKDQESEWPPSSSTQEMEAEDDEHDEDDGEACGVSEPTTAGQSLSPDRPAAESKDRDNGEVRKKSGGPQSGLNTERSQKSQRVKRQRSAVRSMGRNPKKLHPLKSAKQDAPCCKVCGKSFTSNAWFLRHLRTHTKDVQCICGVCGKHIESAESFGDHLETHSSLLKPHSCSVCGKEFPSAWRKDNHMRNHTGVKPYSCSVCNKGFSQHGHLKVHMRIHTGDKPYSCTVCGNRYNQRTHVIMHMRIHTGEKPYSCSVCDKAFNQVGSLNIHMRIHTGERPYACSRCGQTFRQKQKLTHHLRIHDGLEPFSCSFCNRKYVEKASLKYHMRVHTGEKPHQCSLCDKAFCQRLQLTTHMISHTGQKPFTCSICGKGFTQASSMTVHMNIHTGERPHRCTVCGKGFGQRSHLVRHMRLHTGEEYNCTVCGRNFSQRSYLTKHKRSHSAEKPFTCTVCNKKFKHRCAVIGHMRSHKVKKM